MKKILIVVDEKCIGGVSTLLCDMLNMSDIATKNEVDLLILHNRGDGLKELPKSVNVIYGTKYFSAIDLSLKDIIKGKNIKAFLHKLRVVIDLKTGLIKKKIVKERKKMLKKEYDYEVAFKDGFTAIFTAYGNSKVKYHWIQYDYSIKNPNKRYAKIFLEILPQFDKIIAVSQGIKKDFNAIYSLGNRVEIIENLVDTNKIIDRSKEKCDVILDKSKTNIVCVGRLNCFHKGYDRLVKIISRLNDESLFENTILRIYGDGPDRKLLENLIKTLNLSDKVILYGMVSNPYKYIKDNNLFILPSRYEAFGLVIVESLSLGVPVLATDNGAISSLIKDGYNGKIVENNDESLYDGFKKLLEDENELKSYKKNLKKYRYTNADILNKISKLFE